MSMPLIRTVLTFWGNAESRTTSTTWGHSATPALLGSVFLELVVDPTVDVRRPTVVDLALLSERDLVAAELARRTRAVGLVRDEPDREQVDAAAEVTARHRRAAEE